MGARDLTDKARSTIKQTTLHSGRGHLGRQDGNIGYSRDCKDKAKPTIKQTTLHSGRGHIGKQDGNITYARDLKDKAKVTIKQTTLLQNHTGPLKAEVEKHKGETAERNMTIDERKEILTYNRPANPKSDRVGPVLTKNNVILKKENFIKRQNYGFDKSNCNLNRLNTESTRGKLNLN